jgi:phenylacetate-CoA ligase
MLGLAHDILTLLQRTERMPAPALRQYQTDLLGDALRHARRHVKAYASRLDPVLDGAGRLDLSRWSELPVLTKEEVRAGGDDHFAHDLPDHLKPLAWSTTTGTTAQPLLVAKTQLALLLSSCQNERMLQWHGLDPGKPLALLRFTSGSEADYPEGQTLQGWSLSSRTGPHHLLSVRSTLDQQIDWLERRRPAYLSAYPSIAAAIAARLGERGKGLGLEAVLTYGEALSAEQRWTIESGLGARVVDAYTANEIGFVAVQCPVSGEYHVCSESILVEVVDEAGRLAPPGQPGEVLLTPFYNTVMPLIRYRIGDIGVLAEGPCPCGRTLPRLAEIGGRTRELFRYADGTTRFANLHSGQLQACVPLKQFQLVQHSEREVELLFVPLTDNPQIDEEALTELARRDLHPDVRIRATPTAEIPRGPGHKLQRTVSHVRGTDKI